MPLPFFRWRTKHLFMRIQFAILLIAFCCVLPELGRAQKADSSRAGEYYWLPFCKQPPEWWNGRRMLEPINDRTNVADRKKWLEVSGQLSYQYFQRQSEVEQISQLNNKSHLLHVQLDVIYKERLPLRVDFRYNAISPLQTDNLFELNLGFDRAAYQQLLFRQYERKLKKEFEERYAGLRSTYEARFRDWKKVEREWKGLAGKQVRAEEQLRSWRKKQLKELPLGNPVSGLRDSLSFPGFDLPVLDEGLLNDSLVTAQRVELQKLLTKPFEQWSNREDSLLNLYRESLSNLKGLKQQYQQKLDSIQQLLSYPKNFEQLEQGLSDNLNKHGKGEGLRNVLMRSRLRAGKFLVNMSELTVNNIFVHGASVRYGESKYVELLAGAYDFAFRQLFGIRNDSVSRNRPAVMAVRLGQVFETGSHVFTFYTGKKTLSSSLTGGLRQVSGFSYEYQRRIGTNWNAVFEIAKSTARPLSTTDKVEEGLQALLTRFRKETLAASGQLIGVIRKSQTDLELSFRYWGQRFESFNATQLYNPQNQWRVQVRQPFWKRRVFLSGGLRYSDFRTAGIASNLRSRTLFSSANLVLRLPKAPVFSVGYYPGSQLYWLDANKLYEYFYSILQFTASHHFRLAKVPMQVTASYNRFTNEYRDSIVSPVQDMMNVYWSAWKGAFTYSLNGSLQRTEIATLQTLEAGLAWAAKGFRIGGTVKWNQMGTASRLAGSARLGFTVGRLGTINCLFDRSFFPDRQGDFIPVSMGQIQYIKPLNFSLWR